MIVHVHLIFLEGDCFVFDRPVVLDTDREVDVAAFEDGAGWVEGKGFTGTKGWVSVWLLTDVRGTGWLAVVVG